MKKLLLLMFVALLAAGSNAEAKPMPRVLAVIRYEAFNLVHIIPFSRNKGKGIVDPELRSKRSKLWRKAYGNRK